MPILLNAWTKVLKKEKDIFSEYECNIKSWNKSGMHCLFDRIYPGEHGESTGPNMECVHGFMVTNQNLLDVVLSHLPAGVFSESTRISPSRSNGADRDRVRKLSANPFYTKEVLSSISTKTFMVESKSSVELQSTLNHDKHKEKNHRHNLFLELHDHCWCRHVAKTRLGKYKKHKSPSGGTGNQSSIENEVEEVDTNEETKDGAEYTNYQESLLGEIFESDQ